MAKKPETDLVPEKKKEQPKRLDVLNLIGEPERICGNCDHWEISKTAKDRGLCHNLISGQWETKRTSTCARAFYPDCTRFPLEKRYHEGART